jgi:hypothetical protein
MEARNRASLCIYNLEAFVGYLLHVPGFWGSGFFEYLLLFFIGMERRQCELCVDLFDWIGLHQTMYLLHFYYLLLCEDSLWVQVGLQWFEMMGRTEVHVETVEDGVAWKMQSYRDVISQLRFFWTWLWHGGVWADQI